MDEISVSIYQGTSKKTGNSFEAINLKIGNWSQLVFPRSTFEMDYIKQILDKA